MRLFLNVSAVLVCGGLAGVTALAQSAPSHAASMQVMAIPLPSDAADANELQVRHGGNLEAHFGAANTTHDGHLTLAQATQASWNRVAKHFDEIDTDHKGWVSVEQIHAYNKSHRKHRKDATPT